jgi:ribose transport system permease protein
MTDRKAEKSLTGSSSGAGDMFWRGVRVRLRREGLVQRFSLVIVWGIVVLVFSLLSKTSGTFPTVANFSSIFGTQAVLVVLTLGILIPLTAGDYDLSVAATLTAAAMMVAILNANDHWSIYLTMIVVLAMGATVGFVNGAIVVLIGVDPFIVTLGMATFIEGVVLWMSNSLTISGVSTGLVTAVALDRFLSVPLEFWYAIALMVVLWYVFEFTAVGRRLLFVGRGRSVSRLSGINVGRARWGAFVASGTVAAGAGIMYVGTTGAADPTSGLSFLLPAYAAAFLGATCIMPGRFNPIGATIAVYFLTTGISGLQLFGAQSYVQELFYGAALVIAVALTQISTRRQGQSGVPSASG